jgi:eukaryotic-like serine/threonine-protein kinase
VETKGAVRPQALDRVWFGHGEMTESDAPVPFLDALSGRVVDGRYKIGRLIGKGAMGIVYEAEHVLVGRKIAVKFGYAGPSSSAFERFRREAKAAAAVGNAHIVDVLDMGRLDAGTSYMVLERLEGKDLGFTVASEGRFTLRRALNVALQLCDALSAVHAVGIVHRDLKPENVFLTRRDGRVDFVKVLDFGVCKVREPGGTRVTASGEAIGTPQFMAPEQAEGRSDVDHRADLYSLGAILYFLLADKPPFDAATWPQLLLKITYDSPPPLSEREHGVPPELDAVVQRALAKNPEQRFQTCEELKAALEPFSQEVDALASTAPTVRSLRPAASSVNPSSTAPHSAASAERATPTISIPLQGPGKRAAGAALVVGLGALALLILRSIAPKENSAHDSQGVPAAASSGSSQGRVTAPPRASAAVLPSARASEPEAPVPTRQLASGKRAPLRVTAPKPSASAVPASTPSAEAVAPAPSGATRPATSATSTSMPNAAGVGISRPLKTGI